MGRPGGLTTLREHVHQVLVSKQRPDCFPDPHAQIALRERQSGHLGSLGRNLIRQAWTQRRLDHLTLAPHAVPAIIPPTQGPLATTAEFANGGLGGT